jgi:hypothetical protein
MKWPLSNFASWRTGYFDSTFALTTRRVSATPRAGRGVCGHQLQPASPDVTGVGGAVAVLGVSCQIGAVHCLAGPSALDRLESATHTSSV